MALQALNPEAVQPTVQALLAFLDREDVLIPGSMNESITSAKSLCRAILSGQLIIAQEPRNAPEQGDTETAGPAAKKAAKKAA